MEDSHTQRMETNSVPDFEFTAPVSDTATVEMTIIGNAVSGGAASGGAAPEMGTLRCQ